MKYSITKQQLLTATLYNNERNRLLIEAKKLQAALGVLALAEEQLIKTISPEIDLTKHTLKVDAQAMTVECVDKE